MENFEQNQTSMGSGQSQGSGGDKKKTIIILTAVVVGLIILSAIGAMIRNFAAKKTAESFLENALEKGSGGKVDVNLDDKTMKVKTSEGEAVWGGEGVEIPDSCRKDIPIYPGAKVMVASCATDNSQSTMISLETSDGQEQVINYYKSELAKNGWTQKQAASTGVGFFLGYQKGNDMITLSAGKTDDGTKTNIFIGISKGSGN